MLEKDVLVSMIILYQTLFGVLSRLPNDIVWISFEFDSNAEIGTDNLFGRTNVSVYV